MSNIWSLAKQTLVLYVLCYKWEMNGFSTFVFSFFIGAGVEVCVFVAVLFSASLGQLEM